MNKDSPVSQLSLSLWSLGVGLTTGGVLYFIGFKSLALGIFFGLVMILVSWVLLDKTLIMAFSFSSPYFKKAASFMLYHARFASLVLIMFLVIPKTNLYFGIGTFFGFLIPKMVLGAIIYRNRSEEWWLKREPSDINQRDLKPALDDEILLLEPDFFSLDPVELEIRRYYHNKGEFRC